MSRAIRIFTALSLLTIPSFANADTVTGLNNPDQLAIPGIAAPLAIELDRSLDVTCVTGCSGGGGSSTVGISQTTPGTTNGVQTLSGSTTLATQPTATALNAQVQGNVAGGATDSGNALKAGGVFNTTPPTYTTGQRSDLQVGSRGSLNVSLLGQNSLLGADVLAQNADAVVATTNALNVAAFNKVYNGTTFDRQTSIQGATATGLGVTAVHTAPTSAAGAALLSTQTAVAASALAAKSGAGNLYGFSGVATVTGYFLVFDATAAPADGTVTPKKCYPYPTANSSFAISWGTTPMHFSTGLTVAFSTTGCFTKTASTTAFLAADYE